MRRKRIKVEILVSAIVVLVASGGGGVFVRPAMEPDRTIESRFGDVAWNHELHARLPSITNCTVCHHNAQQGDMDPEGCDHCHPSGTNANSLVVPGLFLANFEPPKYEGEDGPPARVALHSKCIGCHRAMEEGPVGCRDCHAMQFTGEHGVTAWDHFLHARKIVMDEETGLEGNCVHCHHQDEDAVTDEDYRSCSRCHEPAAATGKGWRTEIKGHEDFVHLQCDECHAEFNPEDDLRDCADCHPDQVVDNSGVEDEDAKERPSIEAAMHKLCEDCHNPDHGLSKGVPETCDDCHRPDKAWIDVPGVGPIMWPHDRHARFDDDINCGTCHHTDFKGEHHSACVSCHGTDVIDNPPLDEAFSELCLGCHEEKGNGLDRWDALRILSAEADSTDVHPLALIHYEGPDGDFHWNLQRHAVDYGLSCRDCHHATLKNEDGDYLWSERISQSWPDEAARIGSCRDCHGQTGPVTGSVAQGTDAPDIHAVYKTLCVECHQELGVIPGTWEALFDKEKVSREASE